MPLNNGQILQSRYRILRPLGQGGMGTVYLAHDLRLAGRLCAVKENVPDPTANPQTLAQLRQQFQAEASVLAQLDHPNLPKVSDFFSEAANEYLVMEHIDGENLADLLARQGGPLPEPIVLGWADQVLDALHYLHGQHPNPVIHRDIKPANIILTPHGTVKLVDFGLVKLLDPSKPGTATAMKGMGTPEYAPPEQYAGAGHTDPRSDIFSLGAMLYHLLTGGAPPDVHQRVLSPAALAPLRRLNPGLSAGIEAAVMKAIELQPGHRWQTAHDFRNALKGKLPTSRPSRSSVPAAWAAGIVGLTAVAVGIVVGALWLRTQARTAATPPAATAASAISMAATPAVTRALTVATSTGPAAVVPTLTPTSTLAPTATSTPAPTSTPTPAIDAPTAGLAWVNTSDDLFLWDPAVLEARQVDTLAGSRQWEWAPDGEHLAYQRVDGDLYVGTLADEPWWIAASGDFDWAPDGRQLAYLDLSGERCVLHVVNSDGSGDRILADLTGEWSVPGGGGGEATDLVLELILSREPFEPSNDNGVWWTRDGRRIAVQRLEAACTATLVGLDGDKTPCSEEWSCESDETPYAPESEPVHAPVILLADEEDALWRFNYLGANIVSGGSERPTAREPGLVIDLAARSRLPNWGFNNNFWLSDSSGSSRRVTESESFKWLGSWSPEGSWIAYADLLVSDGEVVNGMFGEVFDAQTVLNLWALAPESGRTMQMTTSGDLQTFSWQPNLPVSESSMAPISSALMRPRPNGVFEAASLSAVLDGRFDEWSGPWQPLLAVIFGAEQRSDTDDLDARFRVAWDPWGLYLALQITDEAYRPGPSGEKLWQGDSVEFHFDRELAADFADSRNSSDDYQIGISFGPSLGALNAHRWLPPERYGAVSVIGQAIPTSFGYDAELFIPWEAFDVTADQAEEGAVFGFNLSVNDNDGVTPGQQSVLSSSAARTTFDSPVQWGTLTLSTALP